MPLLERHQVPRDQSPGNGSLREGVCGFGVERTSLLGSDDFLRGSYGVLLFTRWVLDVGVLEEIGGGQVTSVVVGDDARVFRLLFVGPQVFVIADFIS